MTKSMKVAGLAGIFAVILASPTIAHCVVNPGDFAALSLSKSALTDQNAVDALTDSKQALLCSTRTLVAQAEKGGGHLSSEPGQFSVIFMSPQEISVLDTAVTEWIAAAEKAQAQADSANRPTPPAH